MTREEFIRVVRGTAMEMGTDPKKWTFGGLKRTGKDGTGRFSSVSLFFLFLLEIGTDNCSLSSDNDLVCVLTEATEEAAGAYKARGKSLASFLVLPCAALRLSLLLITQVFQRQ